MEVKIAMAVYIAFTAILAIAMVRKGGTSKEFFLGSSGLGTIFVLTMIFSETIGGTGTVGDCAEAYSSIGMGAVWSTWGMALGCVLFVMAFGKFYRVLGATRGVKSVASAYEIMFGRATKVVILLIVSVVYMCMFALQPVAAAGILSPIFGIDRNVTIVIVGVIFIAIACAGGLKGLARMNKVHAFFMWFGLFATAALAMRAVGGANAIAESAPNGYLSVLFPGLDTIMVWVIGAIFSQMSSAILATICLSADNLQAMRKGTAIAAVLMATFACFPAIIGICASIAMPGIDPQTALYSFSEHLSPWIGGLASIAVIAAIFSTAPSLLLIVGTTLSEDLYKGFIRKQAQDKSIVAVARLSMAVLGVLALVMGMGTTSIFSQLLSIFQIRSIVAIVLLVALVWPRVNGAAAFWSILVGGGVAAVWHFLGAPLGIQPLIPSLLLGLTVLVVVTLASKERMSDGYREYMVAREEYEATCPAKVRIGSLNCAIRMKKAMDE